MFGVQKKYKINRNRPTVGVTGPDKGGGTAWFFTALAVWLAGGWPVRITPFRPRTADGLQALIIGGGADVDPNTYEQEHVLEEYLNRTIRDQSKTLRQKISRFTRWAYYPALYLLRKILSRKKGSTLDLARDHLELQLIDQAVKKELPVLGICRGSQLLNVYFKGTLYHSINSFYMEEPNPSSVFPIKQVFIKPNSKLAQVLQVKQLEVNALHHQAVKEPGTAIEVVAQEFNGVVQGIESTAQDFVVGVQWHPEYLPQSQTQRRIFKALVQKAREVRQQIEGKDMQEVLAKPQTETLATLAGPQEQNKTG